MSDIANLQPHREIGGWVISYIGPIRIGCWLELVREFFLKPCYWRLLRDVCRQTTGCCRDGEHLGQ